MNDTYEVWFEGEDAQRLAAKSDIIVQTPDDFVYLLKVGEEMPLKDVIQHHFRSQNSGSTTYYSIQYKDAHNVLQEYEFSYFEQVKIEYRDDITEPMMKRVENDVFELPMTRSHGIPRSTALTGNSNLGEPRSSCGSFLSFKRPNTVVLSLLLKYFVRRSHLYHVHCRKMCIPIPLQLNPSIAHFFLRNSNTIDYSQKRCQ